MEELSIDIAYLMMTMISLIIGKRLHLMMMSGMLVTLHLVTNRMKELILEQYGNQKMLEEMMEIMITSY